MEAGRELDALVGEKVMGMRPPHRLPFFHHQWVKPPGGHPAENAFMDLPHFSTDIAAAWRVVEGLRARGFTVNITLCPSPTLWRVDLRFNTQADTVGCVTSEVSASHAICLAALKTAGAI